MSWSADVLSYIRAHPFLAGWPDAKLILDSFEPKLRISLPTALPLFRLFDRMVQSRADRAMLMTLLVAGYFLVWGGLHGAYYIISQYTLRWRKAFVGAVALDRHPAIHGAVQIAITFTIVCFAWIFFRAADLSTALSIIGSMAHAVVQKLSAPLSFLGLTSRIDPPGGVIGTHVFEQNRFYFTLGAIALFGIWEMRREFGVARFADLLGWQRWTVYYAACVAMLLIGNMGNKQFIYFQF